MTANTTRRSALLIFVGSLFLCGFDIERASGSASAASYSQIATLDDVDQTLVLQSSTFYSYLPLQYSDGTPVVRHLSSEQLALSWQFIPRFFLRARAGGAYVPKLSGNRKHLGFSSKDVHVGIAASPWAFSILRVGGGIELRVPAFGFRSLGEGAFGMGAHFSARLDVFEWLRFDAQLKGTFASEGKSGVEILIGAELSWRSFSIPFELIHKSYVSVDHNVWAQHPSEARVGVSMLWRCGQGCHFRTTAFVGASVFPGVGAPLFRAGMQFSGLMSESNPKPRSPQARAIAP